MIDSAFRVPAECQSRAVARAIALGARYLSAGLLNTAVGYAVILAALHLGTGDYFANAAGYGVGLLLAYHLHRRWTFAVQRAPTRAEHMRFAIAVALAYAANLAMIALVRAAGFVNSPLGQAMAMATYSASFFVLARYFVFVQRRAVPDAIRSRMSWAPPAVVGALALAAWVALRWIRPMNDVVWQFWIARQLLSGVHLYTDIWEVNPPLWFWSATPVAAVARATGIGWQPLLDLVLVGVGAGSALLTGALIAPTTKLERSLVVGTVFVASTLIFLVSFGQREQIALVSALPYAALVARRRCGEPVHWGLAITAGALGSWGFALKHYFVLVPLALEVWLFAAHRRGWRPLRPELAVLVTAALAYAVAVAVWAPDFFRVMVPMVRAAYYALLPPVGFILMKPFVGFWVLAAALLLISQREVRVQANTLAAAYTSALVITGCAFAVGYVAQRRGWQYHAIPASGAFAAALMLELQRVRRLLPIAMGGVLISWLACVIYPPVSSQTAPDPALARVPSGQAVFVAAIDAGLAWPLPDTRHLVWSSRSYSMWMEVAVAEAEQTGQMTPALASLGKTVAAAASKDIRCTAPYLIIFYPIGYENGRAPTPGLQTMLFQDAALRRFVTTNYRATPRPDGSIAWWRMHPMQKPEVSGCRKVVL